MDSTDSIQLLRSNWSDARQQIIQRLISYNEVQVGSENSSDVVIVSRDSRDELLGGIAAYTQWNWLFVSHLWVSEQSRDAGLGSRLLKAAETVAAERQCYNAHLEPRIERD